MESGSLYYNFEKKFEGVLGNRASEMEAVWKLVFRINISLYLGSDTTAIVTMEDE